MSDDTWVTLTPEQVEALDQGVIVRAHRGDTMVQGPLEGLVGEDRPDVWVGDIRVKASERVEVRVRDMPQLEDTGEPDLLAALAASVARARARREDSTASPVVEDPTCTECGEPVDPDGLTRGECGGGGGQKCGECFACSCDGSC